ncbi:tryptophan synthase beta subunit-like PLP-dependent enzyme [Haematococcus lacustris]
MNRHSLSLETRSKASQPPGLNPGCDARAPVRAMGWGFGLVRWFIKTRPSAHQNTLSVPFLTTQEYEPPAWARHLGQAPRLRVGLGLLPSPLHRWHLGPELLPEGVTMWIKRDDLTGMELSGNKVRKLEFLLAEAQRAGHDCVVTIGGVQSNHCRATAVAAKYLGLPCHLLLRTSRQKVTSDPGLEGNLLVSRLVGATLHLVTKSEYASVGSAALGEQLVAELREQGLNPFLIPVGGSNALGTWGYLQAVEEIRQQLGCQDITDIVAACGSGGTTAGLALGSYLSGMKARVHAYGVCDSPDYFYDFIDGLLEEMAHDLDLAPTSVPAARGLLRAVQAKGLGYAESSEAELQTVKAVAEATGVILDPVYGGKALHGLLHEIRSNPESWRGRKWVV